MQAQNQQEILDTISNIKTLLNQLDHALFETTDGAGSTELLAEITSNFHKLSHTNFMENETLKNQIIGLQAQMDTIIQKATQQSSENKANMVNVLQRIKAQQSYGK